MNYTEFVMDRIKTNPPKSSPPRVRVPIVDGIVKWQPMVFDASELLSFHDPIKRWEGPKGLKGLAE